MQSICRESSPKLASLPCCSWTNPETMKSWICGRIESCRRGRRGGRRRRRQELKMGKEGGEGKEMVVRLLNESTHLGMQSRGSVSGLSDPFQSLSRLCLHYLSYPPLSWRGTATTVKSRSTSNYRTQLKKLEEIVNIVRFRIVLRFSIQGSYQR